MLSIKLAKISDRDTINLIMRRSLTHWCHDDDYINIFMNKLAVTDDYIKTQSVHLTYSDNQLCGFFSFKNKKELDSLFLLPEFIGKGLGRLAWNSLCEYAGKQNLTEFVIYSQPGSEGFYLKMGSEKIGEQTSFIKQGMMIPILKYKL
jgi:GNAT superfamily N-acetyltransferase